VNCRHEAFVIQESLTANSCADRSANIAGSLTANSPSNGASNHRTGLRRRRSVVLTIVIVIISVAVRLVAVIDRPLALTLGMLWSVVGRTVNLIGRDVVATTSTAILTPLYAELRQRLLIVFSRRRNI